MAENIDAAAWAKVGAEYGCWQPIETAPKDGTNVLIWPMHGYRVGLAFFDTARGGVWSEWPGRVGGFVPTHWMPLPEPPTIETERR